MSSRLPSDDIQHILAKTEGLWEELRHQNLFLTGGTGFFGHWLLESFLAANQRYELEAHITVLTRDPETFLRKSPHFAGDPFLQLWRGDVRDFSYPLESFYAVIHAATEASAKLNEENPELMKKTIIEGTGRVLDFARAKQVKKILFTSSGAVYGPQPPDVTHVGESYAETPHFPDVASAYGVGKQEAEKCCLQNARAHGFDIKIARCFAFVGPHLPLDTHFAIGNFIRDCLQNRPIEIKGDGSPCRSYLYGADLAIWLWTILLRGRAGRAYNVGSAQAVSIRELASVVGKVCGRQDSSLTKIHPEPLKASRYVPSIRRAEEELGLAVWIELPEAVQRTWEWHKSGSKDKL